MNARLKKIAPRQAPASPLELVPAPVRDSARELSAPPTDRRASRGQTLVRIATMALIICCDLGGCAHHTPRSTYHETGVASWYGARFQGHKTANGERFDMHAFTAAHRTLPLGSKVRVHSRTTGQTVVVRINDRGPQDSARVLDLSYAAAQALGIVKLGTDKVEIEAE